MFVKRVQRLLEKMAEGHDHQYHAECQEGVIHAPADEKEGSSNQFNQWNGKTDSPEGPGGQKCVLIRKEPPAHVANRGQGEDLEHSGHEEDESQDESREEDCPGARSQVAGETDCFTLKGPETMRGVRSPATQDVPTT